jgi:hypothetical protein
MPTPRYIDRVTEELDEAMEELQKLIKKGMPKVLESVYEQVLELTATINPSSSAVDIILANQQVTALRNQITEAVTLNRDYQLMLFDVSTSFIQVAEISRNYLTAAFVDLQNNPILGEALTQQATATTLELMTGAGVDANFTAQIQNIIKTWQTGKGNRASLNQLLRQAIKGDAKREARLSRYVKQVSNDSIEQFNRAYMETLTSDIDVDYWIYSGTTIKDSRPFCKARVGKAFTTKQVQSWASLTWDGKIPATNKATIKTYLGGYNCRHRLLPISKEAYEEIIR